MKHSLLVADNWHLLDLNVCMRRKSLILTGGNLIGFVGWGITLHRKKRPSSYLKLLQRVRLPVNDTSTTVSGFTKQITNWLLHGNWLIAFALAIFSKAPCVEINNFVLPSCSTRFSMNQSLNGCSLIAFDLYRNYSSEQVSKWLLQSTFEQAFLIAFCDKCSLLTESIKRD